MYSYPNHSGSSRPTYSVQTPASSKDDGKHHATVYVGQGNVLSQNAQRSKFLWINSNFFILMQITLFK
jgi:hypothetical protein